MYSGQDSERVMELLRARGLEASIDIGIVTGTGLANIVKEVENALDIPYDDLPGFPQGFVSGHARRLVGRRPRAQRLRDGAESQPEPHHQCNARPQRQPGGGHP